MQVKYLSSTATRDVIDQAEYLHAVSGLQTTGSSENKWHGVWWEPGGQRGGQSPLVWSVES